MNLITSNRVYNIGKLTLDPTRNIVSVGKKNIHLTSREASILEYLVKYRGDIIPRKKLLRDIWGDGYSMHSNVIDVHIKNLRKKIQSKTTSKIETIRGVGYKIEDN